jgi:mono/diheme cytochrome c family protein
MKSRIYALFVIALVLIAGCREQPRSAYEPNMLYAHALEVQSGYPMQRALQESQDALAELFGPPDAPVLPKVLEENKELAQLLQMERIRAASPASANGGPYQKHCSVCHGLVGNGRGLTAALLDPYPRDYRAGKFKYKSTPRGAKPTRDDLKFVIRHGIEGTSMKAIPELTNDDVELLVDYVVYLSIRGEFEREMLREAENIEFENGDSLYDVKLKISATDKFAEQQERAKSKLEAIAASWVEASDRVRPIVVPPPEIPVPATTQEVLIASQSPEDSPLKRSIARGQDVFLSEAAACAKCHGKTGYGDGQTQDYDDWTKEWTVRIGIDPTDEKAQIPFIARGALPARKSLPRDFRVGLYRGGHEPEQIYRRIIEGIDGTPMPAATIPTEDIWHLVNYVRSLAVPVETASQ